MSEISVQKYLAEHGQKISWQEAVGILLPAIDSVLAGQEPDKFCKNICLEQICIDPESGRVRFNGEKVPFASFDLREAPRPEYIPWELCSPWGRRGSASEVYSFAACLYTAVSGSVPPAASARVEGAPLPTPTSLGAELPAPAEDLLRKGLALNAADRYSTLEEFRDALAASCTRTDEPPASAQGDASAEAASPAGALDLRQIKTVSSTKSLESPAPRSSTQEPREKERKGRALLPAAAIAGAFCIGLLGYQLTARTLLPLASGPVSPAAVSSAALDAAEPTLPPEDTPVEAREVQTVQYDDGSTYEGEWSQDARNGHGVLTLANGSVYEGDWTDDLLQGHAQVEYILDAAQGWVLSFEGEFTANEPNGAGTYRSAAGSVQNGSWSVAEEQSISLTAANTSRAISGSYAGMLNDAVPGGYGKAVWTLDSSHTASYAGEWQDGVPTGKGTYTAVNGESLSGEWSYASAQKITASSGAAGTYTGLLLDGKPAGLGITLWSSGEVSVTEYKNAQRSGYGFSYGKNGDQYTGLWSADAMSNGTGSYTYSDGSRFSGTWSGAQRTGTLTTAAGETYKGTWQNNVLTGKATYTNARGESYDGSWSAGKKNGSGTYKWANGDVYTGSWSNDRPNGSGTMRYANGDSYAGTWTNGSHADAGTYKWANGDSFEGTLVNGLKEGSGVYTWANGDSYSGSWSGDLQNGKGTMQYAAGASYTGSWVNGQKSGSGTYKWPNGDSFTGSWAADQKDGSGVYTWANGTTYSGIWANGTPRKGGTYTYTDAGVSELLATGALTMCS